MDRLTSQSVEKSNQSPARKVGSLMLVTARSGFLMLVILSALSLVACYGQNPLSFQHDPNKPYQDLVSKNRQAPGTVNPPQIVEYLDLPTDNISSEAAPVKFRIHVFEPASDVNPTLTAQPLATMDPQQNPIRDGQNAVKCNPGSHIDGNPNWLFECTFTASGLAAASGLSGTVTVRTQFSFVATDSKNSLDSAPKESPILTVQFESNNPDPSHGDGKGGDNK